MRYLIRWIARAFALGGLLLCAGAILARANSAFTVGPFQTGTLLLAGVAALVLACLSYLVLLVEFE